MAKAELNSLLRHLHGSLGGLMVTQAPQMVGIKPTPAQRGQRDRFRQAAQFHRSVLGESSPRISALSCSI